MVIESVRWTTCGMEPIQSVVSGLSSKLAIATTRSHAVFVILDNHDCYTLHAHVAYIAYNYTTYFTEYYGPSYTQKAAAAYGIFA